MGATSAYYVQYRYGVVCIYAIILSENNTGIFIFIIAALLCPAVRLVYLFLASSDYGAGQFGGWRKQPSRHQSVFDAEVDSFESNTFVNSMIYLVMFRSVRKGTGEMCRAVCPDDYWKGAK